METSGKKLHSRGLDMATDKTTRRDAGSLRTDQIGKVFTVLEKDLRQCLICEGIFVRQAASEHSVIPCIAGNQKTGGK